MKKYLLVKMTVLFAAILCFGISHAWCADLYANAAAAGGDGKSWETAFTDLQSALDEAVLGDEIWVAASVYTPRVSIDFSSDPRTAAFILKKGVYCI